MYGTVRGSELAMEPLNLSRLEVQVCPPERHPHMSTTRDDLPTTKRREEVGQPRLTATSVALGRGQGRTMISSNRLIERQHLVLVGRLKHRCQISKVIGGHG